MVINLCDEMIRHNDFFHARRKNASSTSPSLGFSIHCFPKYYNPITLNLTHYWSELGFGLMHTYIFFVLSFHSFIFIIYFTF